MKRILLTLVGLVALGAVTITIWVNVRAWQNNETITDEPAEPLPEPLSYATKPEVGALAPNFQLQTLDGKEVRLGDYLGKVVVVNFWASWCPFCETQMPTLARLGQLAPADIVILAINRAEPIPVASRFGKNFVLPANLLLLTDPRDEMYGIYEGETMPMTIFIDRDGAIRTIADRELMLSELNEFTIPLRKAPPACWQEGQGRTC